MIIEYKLSGFSVNNFRVFSNKTKFDLTPLTILTGTNSSGKSSFTKALHLLAKSHKANGLRSLELMESDLKIGDFNSIINSLNQSDEISFGIEVETNSFPDMSSTYRFDLVYNSKGLMSLGIHQDSKLLLERSGDLSHKVPIVEKSFIKLPPEIINREKLRKLFYKLPSGKFEEICKSILNYLQTNSEAHNYKEAFYDDDIALNKFDSIDESVFRIIDGLRVVGSVENQKRTHLDGQEAIDYVEEIIYSVNPMLIHVLPPLIAEITDEQIPNEFLVNFLNLDILDEVVICPKNILVNLFDRFEFIDGVRATQEIVYTKYNSPGFYKVLSEMHTIGSIKNLNLKRWIVDEFKLVQLNESEEIEDVVKVFQITGYGYILKIIRNGVNIGLTGLGYGVAQLLPILIKVALRPHAIFVIEEPESNLHPAMQSKLADFFASFVNITDTFNRGPQFIIETHSEYLVRKLQYLTAKDKIEGNKIQLYYFNAPDSVPAGKEQVKRININKDGSLTDNFEEGFFDEATSWKFELLKLNNPQKN